MLVIHYRGTRGHHHGEESRTHADTEVTALAGTEGLPGATALALPDGPSGDLGEETGSEHV